MLRKEEKKLFEKVTKAIGLLLGRLNTKYLDKEISEATKIPLNRISEYKNFDKYQRPITSENLIKLLTGGFITVEEIVMEAKLDEVETKWLKGSMAPYESSEFRKLLYELDQAGVDVIEALKEIKEKRGL